MNHDGKTPGHRPACDEEHDTLVQIGLRTGSPSTGFETSRRDLLSFMGFTLGAVGLSGCRAPVQHAVPLPVASDQIVPGVASVYATTCGGCPSACSLLVTQRDGRPIKIEGNDASPLTGGGTCAAGQATVLSLYDDARLRGPLWMGNETSWPELDRRIVPLFEAVRSDARKMVLVSGTITSPSTRALLEALRSTHPTFRHVVHDPISFAAIRTANGGSFGADVVPHYRFDKARVIVALEADFLGTWLSPVEFARQYAKGRTADQRRSYHVQCEAGMSVTGSNADLRLAVSPSELGVFALSLLAAVSRRSAGRGIAVDPGVFDSLPASPLQPGHQQGIDTIAEALVRHRGECLVVSGSNDAATQTVVNALNALLDNVGTTVELDRPSLQRQGNDDGMLELIAEMERGEVHTLMLWGANPVYDHPRRDAFVNALEKVTLSVSFGDRRDETSAHVHACCPDHHFLESWGDAEPVAGHFSLAQPLIAPLFNTRSAVESLLRWSGRPQDHLSYLRGFWQRRLFPRGATATTTTTAFDELWDRRLERGVFELAAPPETAAASASASAVKLRTFRGDLKTATREILAEAERARTALEGICAGGAPANYELHLHEGVAAREGQHANNPWLLELPDPITRVSWGNVAAIAPATATALGLANGDVVSIGTESGRIEVPVFVQPGQHRRTISVALGFGRTAAGKAGNGVGANAYPLVAVAHGARRYSGRTVVVKTGRRKPLALAQTHFSMEGRPIVQETTVAELMASPDVREREELPDLWRKRLEGAHAWGMSVDLDACTGCSACVVACQAENNVPVVGAEQVRKSRIMHWIRIDRYYNGSDDDPDPVHQPMMCQHCGHAPCETVCPVLATTTSSEGINQQVYNRCIGTRYCANNCPYKVRRFNWHNYTSNSDFDFNMESPLGRLVLNPDVTVRTRGVMEKCSLCVQRIQLSKNQALQERRPIADGDVRTACQQSCPTGAIVFGDLKDPNSRAAKLLAGRRAYDVLEELGTRPNVGYLKKVKHEEKA